MTGTTNDTTTGRDDVAKRELARRAEHRAQELGGKLVAAEILACVSTLVAELARGADTTSEYDEEILSVLSTDDWESAAFDAGWRWSVACEWFEHNEHGTFVPTDDGPTPDAWHELCEEHQLDPYQREAYEHWIVSDWLADRLEEHGEMVTRDLYGLTVWGRCTTGQAIALDGVIRAIALDVYGDKPEAGR